MSGHFISTEGEGHSTSLKKPPKEQTPRAGLSNDREALRERMRFRETRRQSCPEAPRADAIAPNTHCARLPDGKPKDQTGLIFCSFLSELHTLSYFVTGSSQMANLPAFLEVAYVDGVQILHFDSNSRKTKAKVDWVNKMAAEDPHLWERERRISIGNEEWSKVNIEILKKRFNQTGGVHMIQWMLGCEWDDETGDVGGWHQHRYDGEDFISFELKTMRWIAAKPQAFVTKNKWEQLEGLKEYWKIVLTEMCPADLKTHVRHGRDFLMRTELPTLSLLQKTPSSAVTCHATGFYPRKSDLYWRKDGEQLHEDVEMGETLPNHDGTFQTVVHLKVEVTADAEARYECVFLLAGVEEAIVTKLDRRTILSNAEAQHVKMAVAIAVASVVLALLAAGVAAAAVLAKRRRDRQARYSAAPVPTDPEPLAK